MLCPAADQHIVFAVNQTVLTLVLLGDRFPQRFDASDIRVLVHPFSQRLDGGRFAVFRRFEIRLASTAIEDIAAFGSTPSRFGGTSRSYRRVDPFAFFLAISTAL